jgi:hypothetical protein
MQVPNDVRKPLMLDQQGKILPSHPICNTDQKIKKVTFLLKEIRVNDEAQELNSKIGMQDLKQPCHPKVQIVVGKAELLATRKAWIEENIDSTEIYLLGGGITGSLAAVVGIYLGGSIAIPIFCFLGGSTVGTKIFRRWKIRHLTKMVEEHESAYKQKHAEASDGQCFEYAKRKIKKLQDRVEREFVI